MKFLTWLELADRLSVCLSTAKRLYASDPDFPPKVQISPGRVGFREDDADAYMEALRNREVAA